MDGFEFGFDFFCGHLGGGLVSHFRLPFLCLNLDFRVKAFRLIPPLSDWHHDDNNGREELDHVLRLLIEQVRDELSRYTRVIDVTLHNLVEIETLKIEDLTNGR